MRRAMRVIDEQAASRPSQSITFFKGRQGDRKTNPPPPTVMKLIKVAVTLAVVALFGSTQPLMAAGDKPVKVGAAVYGLKAEFMQLWSNYLKAHPAVKSGKVKVTVFDGKYDPNTQNDQFDTMITQQFDAIIFVPIDAEAGAAALQKAHDAKIPVIGSNTRVKSDLLDSY